VVQWLKMLDEDDYTEVIVLIQLAQDINYKALEFISEDISKPIICYIVGSQTPTEKVFRNSIDILNNYLSNSTPATNYYQQIVTTIEKIGAVVVNKPSDIPQLIEGILAQKKQKRA
jgi:succinyl-CoA synthetase alpha subunit